MPASSEAETIASIEAFLRAQRIGPLRVTAHYGIQATDRNLVLEYVAQRNGWPLKVNMPCGGVVVFSDPDAVPPTSLPCPCGDAVEWVIFYTRPNA